MTGTDWNALDNVGKGATVTENLPESAKTTKAKHLKAVPTAYFDAHKELKEKGKTSLDLSAYMIEATREKLERDGGL